MVDFGHLDKIRNELEHAHPGWWVWFVPNSADGTVVWCARPHPGLVEHSPEDLEKAIAEVEAEALRASGG